MDHFHGIRFCKLCRNMTCAKINEDNELHYYCEACEWVEKIDKKDQ